MPDFQIGCLAYPWVTLIFFKRDVYAMTKVTNRTGGPNTKRGKEISSKNARTHGLTAKKWIDNEEQSLYDDMLKELSEDLKPQGFAQELMIARLADCAVRSRPASSHRVLRCASDYCIRRLARQGISAGSMLRPPLYHF